MAPAVKSRRRRYSSSGTSVTYRPGAYRRRTVTAALRAVTLPAAFLAVTTQATFRLRIELASFSRGSLGSNRDRNTAASSGCEKQ